MSPCRLVDILNVVRSHIGSIMFESRQNGALYSTARSGAQSAVQRGIDDYSKKEAPTTLSMAMIVAPENRSFPRLKRVIIRCRSVPAPRTTRSTDRTVAPHLVGIRSARIRNLGTFILTTRQW